MQRRTGLTLMLLLAAYPAWGEPATPSRLGWVTNGTVRAVAVHDQRLYIGGSFTRVAPAADFLGPWFGVSTTTGAALPRLPLADGPIFAIEPDGNGGHFVGGRFTRIGGVTRTALAHVLADGTVAPAFVPALVGTYGVFEPFGLPTLDVRSLARIGDTLYLGGSFAVGPGFPARTGLAALDAVTGALRPWNPPTGALMAERIMPDAGRLIVLGQTLYGPPTALAVDPASGTIAWTRELGFGLVFDGVRAGGRLIVGGSFSLMDGSDIRMVASLDPDTGVIDTVWAPNRPGGIVVSSPSVHAITVIGATVYVGGSFTEFGGLPRGNLAAIDLSLGTVTPWAPEVTGPVRDLAPGAGATVYVAGAFRRAGGLARDGLAEIDTAGAVTSWAPQAHATDVRTLQMAGAQLLAGGTSAVAGGVARENLAGFALDTNDVLPFAPALSEEVLEIGADGFRVFAGVHRTTFSLPPAPPDVMAFDAGSGAPSSWRAPDDTTRLFGVSDGHVYVFTAGVHGLLMRLDAASGAVDQSWRFQAQPRRLLVDRDRVFFLGDTVSLNGEYRAHLFAVDRRSGALSPWNPLGLFPSFPEGSPIVTAAAVMGRTVYVHHGWSGYDISGVVAADRESGVPVRSTAPTGMRVLDLAAADGLLFGIGSPRTAGDAAVRAARPDGTLADWNPGLTLTATDYPWNAQPRIHVSPTDIIFVGVQNVEGTPVHGVAVFARQPSAAASTLEASVIDSAVHLSWTAPDPAAASYIVEAGSSSGASNILVHDTGSGVPALDAAAPAGTYFVRVRSAGAAPGEAASPSNEIAVRVGCTLPMDLPPTRLFSTVSGTTVTLAWDAPAFRAVARYVIETGSGERLANLARLVIPGTQTSFTTDAPPGTYFVRVRAESACGSSPPTPDVWLTVGGEVLPGAPGGLAVTGTGPVYTVQWAPVEGATAYLLEAGSGPGLVDAARVVVNGTGLGPVTVQNGRTYFVRVRAVSPTGIGPPSDEYALVAR